MDDKKGLHHYLKLKAKPCILLVWYTGVNALWRRIHWRERKKCQKRWSEHNNLAEKRNQQDNCQVTSLTCLCGKF